MVLSPTAAPFQRRSGVQNPVAETVKAKSLTVESAARCCAKSAMRW